MSYIVERRKRESAMTIALHGEYDTLGAAMRAHRLPWLATDNALHGMGFVRVARTHTDVWFIVDDMLRLYHIGKQTDALRGVFHLRSGA